MLYIILHIIIKSNTSKLSIELNRWTVDLFECKKSTAGHGQMVLSSAQTKLYGYYLVNIFIISITRQSLYCEQECTN
jgi:hypothetical protein